MADILHELFSADVLARLKKPRTLRPLLLSVFRRPASVLTPRGQLGDGEWEAIALAVETWRRRDSHRRSSCKTIGEAAGLNLIGTLGLLLEAKRAGHIRTIRAELDKLLETSFFLSQQLYDQVLLIALAVGGGANTWNSARSS